MPNDSAPRFRFIAHALRGDGPFRPVVSDRLGTTVQLTGESYLSRYPRESDAKFARRNEVAFYASPLARACSRFAAYLSIQKPHRELPNDLYQVVADDADGKGNAVDVFWQQFIIDGKARGSMLLLVDMPRDLGASRASQIVERRAPFWTAILPEDVTDYEMGDDGRFESVSFVGNILRDGDRKPCIWTFDVDGWDARELNPNGKVIDSGEHGLGECPVLAFSETGEFGTTGPFAAIADLARRLFNLDSELDEILRSQTFSLLTMQVPEGSTDDQKIAAAGVAGVTISTSNLLLHSGSTPAFIAPPDGPARVYLDRIVSLRDQIEEIGLNVATVNQQESGIAMKLRFQAINAELAGFAGRMQDLEARAWELTRKWLGLSATVSTQWPRDFNIADVEYELKVLREMQSSGLPREVIAEQQKRVVSVQFSALDLEAQKRIDDAIQERLLEPPPTGNVVPLRPDPNAELRAAAVRALNA